MSHYMKDLYGERVHKLMIIIHWPLELDEFSITKHESGVRFIGRKGKSKFDGIGKSIVLALENAYCNTYPKEWNNYLRWLRERESKRFGMTFDKMIAPVEKWAKKTLRRNRKSPAR